MHGTKWMAVASVAGMILLGAGCTTCGKPVTSVPAAAQRTIDQYTEGGNIHHMEMKEANGFVLYKADVAKADGSRIELVVNADGKLYKMVRKEYDND